MRRRSFLRGVGALPALGGPAVRPSGARPAGRSRATSDGFEPLARFGLAGAKEAAVAGDGRTVFLAVSDGFAVVDVSDPAAPELLYEDRAPWAGEGNGRLEKVFDVKLDTETDRLAVVGPAQPNRSWYGLIVYDVSDPAAPERLSVHGTEFFNHNCDAAGGYVYLTGGAENRNGLVVVDSGTGEAVGEWSVADAEPGWEAVPELNWVLHDVHVRGDLAFLAQWDAGTWIVDVSDPTAPEPVASVGGYAPDHFASMSRRAARDESIQPPGNDHVTETNEDGTLLAVGVESWDADPDDDRGGPGGVTLYDVSDPVEPVERATIDPPPTPDPTFGGTWTTAHNLDLRGDRLYTSWYAGGVRVYDVSDPAEPVRLAAWRDDDATSFWTAQGATDDAFVAVSRRGRTEGGGVGKAGAELFTFPVPTERVATPTPTPPATPTSTPTSTDAPVETPTDTPAPTETGGTAAPTLSPTGTPTATPTGTDSEPVDSPTDAAGPGFGPLTALVSLSAGAWYALREDD